jgi:hypothetical protein
VYAGPPNISMFDDLDFARSQVFYTLPWYDINNDSVTFSMIEGHVTNLAGQTAIELMPNGDLQAKALLNYFVDYREYYMVINMTDSGADPIQWTVFRVNITLRSECRGGASALATRLPSFICRILSIAEDPCRCPCCNRCYLLGL